MADGAGDCPMGIELPSTGDMSNRAAIDAAFARMILPPCRAAGCCGRGGRSRRGACFFGGLLGAALGAGWAFSWTIWTGGSWVAPAGAGVGATVLGAVVAGDPAPGVVVVPADGVVVVPLPAVSEW